ncbi:uroporphyrinogen decarboxylase [Candidatus Lariskella endosymbiont of Epinotia ramella]|uniref:uroporphyrinogen decarboxylase n=1 Tax=Candidatus Lariskella endosymbiont of Epinotia ramella TaxID=3066224 RepID=UPI0039773C91
MNILLDVLRKKETNKIPIWFMRQAGRYLPEYLVLRKGFSSFIEFCLNKNAALEATLQPLRRFDLDAAIIFSDILILPKAMGLNVDFLEEYGPQITPLINESNITALKTKYKDLEEVFSKIFSAIALVREELNKNFPGKALIGFAGSPWTVACYMIDSRKDKDFTEVRKFAYKNKNDFAKLIDLLTEITIYYLKGQIKNGASVVKLFDSWAGVLPEAEFEKWVISPSKRIVHEVKLEFPEIPIICFPKGSGILYKRYAYEVSPDCIAIDHTIPLDWALNELHNNFVLQGNMDNVLLLCEKSDIKSAADLILEKMSCGGFIFNLGHGILKNTPTENVEYLIDLVRSYRR